jgi:hypothetical protein
MSRGHISGGFILLARKVFEGLFIDKPPLWLALWVWMLCRANFKDRDKLKRGQFVTTISEMQEAMSFNIGYRKIKPSKDQIRSAYEAFAKASMIAKTKTTRGMIITICNYDHYQNPKNYKTHTEARNGGTPKPTTTPHDTEIKGINLTNGKKDKTFSENSIELSLSKLLFSLMIENNPKAIKPNFHEWAVHIDRALRLDNRTPDELEQVIRWSQKDDFEMSNILSTQKLRKRFDQLFLKMKGDKHQRPKGGLVEIENGRIVSETHLKNMMSFKQAGETLKKANE